MNSNDHSTLSAAHVSVRCSGKVIAALHQPLISFQSALQRNHLPSKAEINQSLQIIEKWKSQIESLKQTLSKEEEALSAKRQAAEEACEAKIAALRKELEVTKENLNEDSRLTTEPFRSQLADLEERLQIEQAFVSGIRKIPNEIMIEILELYLSGQIPPRQLALVSKGWRALLLQTPSFWRNLEAFFLTSSSTPNHKEALQKRIELSRSTLLEVTLSIGEDAFESSQPDLFHLIAKTGIDRWRSLKLSDTHYWRTSNDGVINIFQGTFSALQIIEFNTCGYSQHINDPFDSLYKIILQSKPRIKELRCNGELPEPLRGSKIFLNTSKIAASISVLGHLPPLNNLQEIQLNGWYFGQDISSIKIPPLPIFTNIDGILSAYQLNTLQTYSVRHLEIDGLDHSGSTTIFTFPELLSLYIKKDGFQSVKHIIAPKLAKLELKTPYRRPHIKKAASSTTLSLIRDNPQDFTIRPTSFIMDLGINVTAVLAILQYWPQLEYFTLVFGKEFTWKGTFPNSLSKAANLVCPHLITLRMDSHSPDFRDGMAEWERLAKMILLNRKDTPLKLIEWRYNHEEWHRSTFSS